MSPDSSSGSIDPERADNVARRLQHLAHSAEAALEPDELEAVDEAVTLIEEYAGIQHGDRIMNSRLSGHTYRVTRWVELDEDRMIALEKEVIDDE
jgi:hypothetical protein